MIETTYAKQLEDKVARLELEVRCLTRRLEQRPVEFSETLHTRQIMAAKEAMAKAQLERDRALDQKRVAEREASDLRYRLHLLSQECVA